MDCDALLDLVPKAKGRTRRRPSARLLGTATDSADMNADDILALVPPAAKKRKMWCKQIRSNGKRDQMTGAAQQQLVVAHRYNSSGRAIRQDSLINLEGRHACVRGPSGWRRWLPEAIQRAAFSSASNRSFAKSSQDNQSATALGKVGHVTVIQSKKVVASAIMQGTRQGLDRIRDASLISPLNFWITSHVADETKLWYIVRGHGYRKFSTLSHHSQVSWQLEDHGPIYDEDVVRTPEAMANNTSAVQYNILSADGCAGVNPQGGLRPHAKFYGVTIAWDSHRVNKLTAKYLRMVMDPEHLLLPSYCLQHHTGNTASSITTYLNIFTRVWTLCKTFSEGDFSVDLRNKCHLLLDDPEEGLEIVDPETFSLGMNDLKEDFTRSIMDRWYSTSRRCSIAEGAASEKIACWEREKEDFCNFFPCGWNRARPLHLCPPGCCGPGACHSRAASLSKAKRLIDKIVLRKIVQPAQNKWTKMDPAFCQATLMVFFFSLIKRSLERKVRTTYEDLAALGQDQLAAVLAAPQPSGEDQAQENQETYKGAMMRFGKRCLAFVGAPDSKLHLLVWMVVGHVVLEIHYRLFKHCTWYSHAKKGIDRLTIMDFCPGADGKFNRNPAAMALNDLSIMLFRPNSDKGSDLLKPLRAVFGASVHWPEQLVRVFQKSCIQAYCKIWRQLRHRFLCYPWIASCIFNPDIDHHTKLNAAQKYWNAKVCSIDAWIGKPLREELCSDAESLLDEGLQTFVWTLFSRGMVTSTFIERTFAPMTRFTTEPSSRHGLPSVKAKHVNTIFVESVRRWWSALLPEDMPTGRCRDLAAYTHAKGSKTNPWHVYVASNKSSGGIANINAQRSAFVALTPEEQQPYIQKATKIRQQARNRRAPVARALDVELATELPGGPWSMSASKDGLPGDWPLNRVRLCEALGRGNLTTVSKAWDDMNVKVWEEAAEFPETVDMQEPCKVEECLHELTAMQMHRFVTISKELQLALRHSGLPVRCPLLFQLVCEPEVRYCLIGDHDWTHTLRADIIVMEKVKNIPGHAPPFELGLQKETASGQEEVGTCQICEQGWPSIRSETMFVKSLVQLSSDPWHIYALHAAPEQTWSYFVTSKTEIDPEEMRRKEVERLELAFALRLLRKMSTPPVDPKFKKQGKVRKARREGKGRGRGGGIDESEGSTDSVQDLDANEHEGLPEEAEKPEQPSGFPSASFASSSSASTTTAISPEPPPPLLDQPAAVSEIAPHPDESVPVPPPPPPHKSKKKKVAEPWGKSNWSIAPIRDSFENIIGCGATCGDHTDVAFPWRECKKQVTIGKSGLSYATLRLRMKRWLIAGLDDSEWDQDEMQSHHVGIGGKYMCELAEGLSEEACDQIASSQ